MNTSTLNRTLKIAGSVIAFAAMGFADSGDLKANIQFAFTVRGVALPAATYTINTGHAQPGTALYMIRNEQTRASIVMPFMQRAEAKQGESLQPRIVFNCVAESCWVTELWTGSADYHRAASPKVRVASNDKVRVATVYLETRNGN